MTKFIFENIPFSTGTAQEIRDALSASMAGIGEESPMWRGRVEAMAGSLLTALVDLRDAGKIDLNLATMLEYMKLDNIAGLEKNPDISELAQKEIKRYLDWLQGFRMTPPRSREAERHHGYLTSQFEALLTKEEPTVKIEQMIAAALLEVANVDGIKPEEQALINSFCNDPVSFDQFDLSAFDAEQLNILLRSLIFCAMADGVMTSSETKRIMEILGERITQEVFDKTVQEIKLGLLFEVNRLAPESLVKIAKETVHD